MAAGLLTGTHARNVVADFFSASMLGCTPDLVVRDKRFGRCIKVQGPTCLLLTTNLSGLGRALDIPSLISRIA